MKSTFLPNIFLSRQDKNDFRSFMSTREVTSFVSSYLREGFSLLSRLNLLHRYTFQWPYQGLRIYFTAGALCVNWYWRLAKTWIGRLKYHTSCQNIINCSLPSLCVPLHAAKGMTPFIWLVSEQLTSFFFIKNKIKSTIDVSVKL